MTEVLIHENFSETTHSVGNIYKKVGEGLWLLCNVDGKAALVSLKGGCFIHNLSHCAKENPCTVFLVGLSKGFALVRGLTLLKSNYLGGVKFAKTKTTSSPSNANTAGL